MATAPHADPATTLEEFLARPDIDEKPYKELVDGRIEIKMSPQQKHGLIQVELGAAINQFARPRRLGLAFVELRCNYAGRSILPDVTFLRSEHLLIDEEGELTNDLLLGVPDIHVEIVSPDQSVRPQRDRLLHSAAHGTALGWLIDPYRKRVEVVRPGGTIETLPEDGQLTGDPVLPGFVLPVAEIWSWLRPGR